MEQTRNARLSAFIDGEDGFGDNGGFVDRLLDEGKLAETWHRYHLIGDCLRKQTEGCDGRLTASIRQRLAQEPTVLAPRRIETHAGDHRPARNRHSRWTRWAAGTAVAAGVASVVVIGANLVRVELPVAGPTVATQQPATQRASQGAPADPTLVTDRGTRWAVSEPEVASKLNRYIANHSDFVASGALNGMVPLATVVGYDE